MKQGSILIGIILFCLELSGQQYNSFPSSNAIWNYKVVGSDYALEYTVIDSLGGKVSIDSMEYIEIYRAFKNGSNIIGAMREDTISKKIYFHNFHNEIVLYDFNLEVGDTIHYSTNLFYNLNYYKVVNEIDSIEITGRYRKRWLLTNSYPGTSDTWIEGIGSVRRYGLMNPNDPDAVLDGTTPVFGCYKNSLEFYIDSSNCVDACPCNKWLVSLEKEEKNGSDFTLYPNPFTEILILNLHESEESYTNYKIFTPAGSLLLESEIHMKRNVEIDLQHLKSGVYIIKLTGKNNLAARKIVKFNNDR